MKSKEKKDWNRHQKVISAIRKIWKMSPIRSYALKLACVDSSKPVRSRLYRCACCGEDFLAQLMDVDHKIAATKNEPIDVFIDRMFLGISKIVYIDGEPYADGVHLEELCLKFLAVLCASCHKQKTKAENKQRRNKDV